jgi:hypothetical protein
MITKVTAKSWGILADGDYPYLDEEGRPFLCRSEKSATPWLEKGERAVPVVVTYDISYRKVRK